MAISHDKLKFGANVTPHIRRTSGGTKLAAVDQSGITPWPYLADATLDANERKQFTGALALKYELMAEIGSGGMGVIYKAKQPLLDRVYAIKMLHLHRTDSQCLARFHQEAKAVSNLSHPNIIAIHDFGFTGDDPYMVMDFIDGVSLAHLISTCGELATDEALKIFVQIADGMNHAHAQGVLHRDLKPSNIMLCNPESGSPQIKIVDFGIAKINKPDEIGGLTQTGEVFGSPLYMSPEQASTGKVDARSDVYSVGCLMYEVLTGRPPFQAETSLQTMFMHLNEVPPSLSQACPEKAFDDGLEFIIKRCLAKNPSERYQSMMELQKDLVRAASGQHIFKARFQPTSIQSSRFYQCKFFLIFALLTFATAMVCFTYVLTEMHFNQKEAVAEQTADKFSRTLQEVSLNPTDLFKPETFAQRERQDGKTTINLEGLFANDATLKVLDGDKELVSLGLRNSVITADGFKNMNCVNLQQLDLQENDVCEEMFAAVENSSKLKWLSLAKTSVSDKDLNHLLKLKNLEYLDVRQTKITDEGCKILAKMRSLKKLNVAFDNLTDCGVIELTALPTLQSLDLYQDCVTNRSMLKISSMKTLKALVLSETLIGDQSIAILSRMPLTRLQLAGTHITDKSVKYFVKMHSLEFLDLKRTEQLNFEVKHFIGNELMPYGTSVQS